MSGLTHLNEDGEARMVDLSGKQLSDRRALARAIVRMQPATAAAVAAGEAPKGNVIGSVRIAGLMAAKRTAELIPLCHPLGLDQVERGVTIERIELLEKSGGRSGHWTRD